MAGTEKLLFERGGSVPILVFGENKMRNPPLSYARARAGAMVLFAAPGLSYGLFTARLPALKVQTGITESELGIALLLLGAGAVVGLTCANRVVARLGLRPVLLVSAALSVLLLLVASFTYSRESFMATVTLLGLAMGHLDVSMNVLGIGIERAFERATMNTLHAAYSLGGFVGSLVGGALAGLGLGVSMCFALPSAVFLVLLGLMSSSIYTQSERPNRRTAASTKLRDMLKLPAALFVCGLLAFIAYESEGVAGDWGNLYMLREKAAPEAVAALVYGVVAVASLSSRLVADRIRSCCGNFPVLFASSFVAAIGMAAVHFSSNWELALAGFALAGMGLGPIVPILFSISGNLPGVTPSQASSLVSLLGYCGLLLCPAFFGFLAEHAGLDSIFVVVIGFLVALMAGSLVLRGR